MSLPKAWLRLPAGFRVALMLSFVALLAPLFGWFRAPKPVVTGGRGIVRGTIFTPIVDDKIGMTSSAAHPQSGTITLPGFDVFLTGASDSEKVASVVTDSEGKFSFDHLATGEYKICWENTGWVRGCKAGTIHVDGKPGHRQRISVMPRMGPGGGAAWGSVQLQDATSASFTDPGFRVTSIPTVTLLRSGKSAPVAMNSEGSFVIVGEQKGGTKLNARYESLQASAEITSAALQAGGRLDLVIPNHRPVVSEVAVTSGGKTIYEALPGATVAVHAKVTDVDGDPLAFSWRPEVPSVSSVSNKTADGTVNWKLGNYTGLQVLYMMVKDGRGGYASRTVSLAVGEGHGVTIAGSVTGEQGKAVAGASVHIGDTVIRTGADGRYSVHVPRGRDYIAKVTAPGYHDATQTFLSGGTHKPITLIRTAPKSGGKLMPTAAMASCIRFFLENVPQIYHVFLTYNTSDGHVRQLRANLDAPITTISNIATGPPERATPIWMIVYDSKGNNITAPGSVRDWQRKPIPVFGTANPEASLYMLTGSTPSVSDYPFFGCDTIAITGQGTIPGEWFPFLSAFTSTDHDTSVSWAEHYYGNLDRGMTLQADHSWKGGDHSTLGAFWNAAGFSSTGTGGTTFAYENMDDLAMGAVIHMIQNPANKQTFSYQTLYANLIDGAPIIDETLADKAQAADPMTLRYTLVMESTPLYDPVTKVANPVFGNTTKFYVYAGGAGSSPLIDSVNLDGFGEKFAPNVCLNCHGVAKFDGFNATTDPVTDAQLAIREDPMTGDAADPGPSFLPLNLAKFRSPTAYSKEYFGTSYDINTMIVKINAVQPRVPLLVKTWYPTAVRTDPPQMVAVDPCLGPLDVRTCTWSGPSALYAGVFQKSCISCHTALPRFTTFPNDPTSGNEPENNMASNDMPVSLISYRNFWLSTQPCQVLAVMTDPGTIARFTQQTRGACVPPPPTPPVP